MAQRRRFSPEFKVEVVLELLKGDASQAELCRRHNLASDLISKWRKQFLEQAPRIFSNDSACKEHLERIQYLEQLVGRLTLELEIEKKAFSSFSSQPKNRRSW